MPIPPELQKIVKKLSKNDPSLTSLSLAIRKIGDEGALALTTALISNKTLTELDLSKNEITDIGARAIARLLIMNQTIIHLDLGENDIKEEGAKAIAKALKKNRTLISIILNSNLINVNGILAFAEMLNENPVLTLCNLKYNVTEGDNVEVDKAIIKINEITMKNKDRKKSSEEKESSEGIESEQTEEEESLEETESEQTEEKESSEKIKSEQNEKDKNQKDENQYELGLSPLVLQHIGEVEILNGVYCDSSSLELFFIFTNSSNVRIDSLSWILLRQGYNMGNMGPYTDKRLYVWGPVNKEIELIFSTLKDTKIKVSEPHAFPCTIINTAAWPDKLKQEISTSSIFNNFVFQLPILELNNDLLSQYLTKRIIVNKDFFTNNFIPSVIAPTLKSSKLDLKQSDDEILQSILIEHERRRSADPRGNNTHVPETFSSPVREIFDLFRVLGATSLNPTMGTINVLCSIIASFPAIIGTILTLGILINISSMTSITSIAVSTAIIAATALSYICCCGNILTCSGRLCCSSFVLPILVEKMGKKERIRNETLEKYVTQTPPNTMDKIITTLSNAEDADKKEPEKIDALKVYEENLEDNTIYSSTTNSSVRFFSKDDDLTEKKSLEKISKTKSEQQDVTLQKTR